MGDVVGGMTRRKMGENLCNLVSGFVLDPESNGKRKDIIGEN